MEQRIEDKKRGIPRQKHPFVGMLTSYRNVSRLKVFSIRTHHRNGGRFH